jgi:hypothetical protein
MPQFTQLGGLFNAKQKEQIKEIAQANGGGGGAVASVNGQTGVVTLTKSSVGLSNVDNTTDLAKPISSATQTALNTKQPIDAGLTSISGLTGAGYVKAIATDTFGQVTTIPQADVTNLTTDLANKEDITNKSTSTTLGTSNTLYPTQGAVKGYVDNAISTATVGLLDDRGNYDASSNAFPTTGGSGPAGAVVKGDIWTVSVAGTLGGVAVTAGDLVRALVDTPAQLATNWAVSENNIGYVTENVANKSSAVGLGTSNTLYPTQGAVKSYTDTAIATREPTVTAGTLTQYYRGDKTFQTLDKSAVGLSNVDNTSDANKPISTAQATALAGKEPTIPTGTGLQYVAGDKTLKTFPLSLTAKNFNQFQATTSYLAGDVIENNNRLYKATSNFTSGATFVATNWTELVVKTFRNSYGVNISTGSIISGNINETREIFTNTQTIISATMIVTGMSTVATLTTIKIKSNTVDYVTFTVPANTADNTIIQGVLTTALITATPIAPVINFMSVSQNLTAPLNIDITLNTEA